MQAHRGTTVAGFPNYFHLVGPNTGLGHNSMVYMIESQLNYVMDALRVMDEQQISEFEVRPEAMAAYNAQLQSKSLPQLQFGVGIHSGEVIVGVMGAGELNKFTVTGDPINVASRVEGLTREHGVDLLVTEEIRKALDAGFRLRAMAPATESGKSSRNSPAPAPADGMRRGREQRLARVK